MSSLERVTAALRQRQIVTFAERGKATRQQVVVLGLQTLAVPFLLVSLLWVEFVDGFGARAASSPPYARGVILVLGVVLTVAAVGAAFWFHGKEGLKQFTRELSVIGVWLVFTFLLGLLLVGLGGSHLGFWLVLAAVLGVSYAGFSWGYRRAPEGRPALRA